MGSAQFGQTGPMLAQRMQQGPNRALRSAVPYGAHRIASSDRLMSLMTERRIRHLPVVDDRGRLAGIISIGDVVKARLTELEQENQALSQYISGH